jgi:hypothetical protein
MTGGATMIELPRAARANRERGGQDKSDAIWRALNVFETWFGDRFDELFGPRR